MDRLEKLREKPFEIAVWQKLFYQNQKSRIRKRLEAVKYLGLAEKVLEKPPKKLIKT